MNHAVSESIEHVTTPPAMIEVVSPHSALRQLSRICCTGLAWRAVRMLWVFGKASGKFLNPLTTHVKTPPNS